MNTSETTSRRVDTVLLPCVATLLVTNSHLDKLYPDPKFGIGGSLGNTLFFFLSGYGLAISLSFGRGAKENFGSYYWRRIARIYPALLLVTSALFVVQKQWSEGSFLRWLTLVVWPTEYWFIAAIVVFYIPFYWVGKWSSRSLLKAVSLLAIPYLIWFYFFIDKSCFSLEAGYFKWLISFQMMCFGAWVAKRPKPPINVYLAFSGLLGSVLLFYSIKFIVFKLNWGSFQFLVHAMLFPFAWFAYQFLTAPEVLGCINKWKLQNVASWMSGLTLEIYLVMNPVIRMISAQMWTFPIGLLISIVLIGVLSRLLSVAVKSIMNGLRMSGVEAVG